MLDVSKAVVSKANVSSGGNAPSSSPSPAPSDPMRSRIQVEAEVLLSGYLNQVFHRGESLVLRQVSGDCTRQEQAECFEALRILRCERDSFIEACLLACRDERLSHVVRFDSQMELDLQRLQEMMVAEALGQWGREYRDLVMMLSGYGPVTLRGCPWGPHRLCYGFSRALDGLPVREPLKFSLLKLFDEIVLEHLGDIYESLCSMMAQFPPDKRLSREGVTLTDGRMAMEGLSPASKVAASVPVVAESVPLSAPAIEGHPDNGCSGGLEPFWLARVDGLAPGAWLEWRRPGEPTLRYRVAARNGEGGWVLVDRGGDPLTGQTRTSLAAGLRSGQWRILDDGRGLDRTLRAVIGGLRHLAFP